MDMNKKGQVRIIEQPAESSHRFRYESEGRFNKAIVGCSATEQNRTYPTIEISEYIGEVCVIISCVTKDQPYRQHPHKVFSANSEDRMKYGIYTHKAFVNKELKIVYDDIGIMFVKRGDAVESLKERKNKRINPFGSKYQHAACNFPTSLPSQTVEFYFFQSGKLTSNFILLIYITVKTHYIFFAPHFS